MLVALVAAFSQHITTLVISGDDVQTVGHAPRADDTLLQGAHCPVLMYAHRNQPTSHAQRSFRHLYIGHYYIYLKIKNEFMYILPRKYIKWRRRAF